MKTSLFLISMLTSFISCQAPIKKDAVTLHTSTETRYSTQRVVDNLNNPCGMTFDTADLYPDWKENVLAGSLKFNYVALLELSENKVTGRKKIAEDIGGVRNIKQVPDGYIYIAVEGDGIYKIMTS